MLIRTHTVYRPAITISARGILIVTRSWILATGSYARAWA